MFDVSEKPKKVERALLVGIKSPPDSVDHINDLLSELTELLENLNIGAVERQVVRIKKPQAHFLLGSGRTESIIERAKELACDCIVFDNELSPAQQRNWERKSGLCVIDRQEVILDIFSERARTKEAFLQVELARMEYNLPRLKRAWTHLDRQRGGGINQRGAGEAQIELDARMVRARISKLRHELEDVVKHRQVQRTSRTKKPMPVAAIVGYTNAGKSSLLNGLTSAGVTAEHKLFATLDPTTRRLELPTAQAILLTDTVGFVRRLPHLLVDAFKATLEEAIVSDFLIHVLDASSPEVEEHHETTLSVLKELGAHQKPIITVYNKIDLLEMKGRDHLGLRKYEDTCFISTHTGEGLDTLIDRICNMLEDNRGPLSVFIPHNRSDLVSLFHQHGQIHEKRTLDDGVYIRGRIINRVLPMFEGFQTKNGSSPNGLIESDNF